MNQLKRQLTDLPTVAIGEQSYLPCQAVTDAVAAFLFPSRPANQIDETRYQHILETADSLCRDLGYSEVVKLIPPDVPLPRMGLYWSTAPPPGPEPETAVIHSGTVANGTKPAAEKRPSVMPAATTNNTQPPTLPAEGTDDGKPSPIAKQRAQIADFMKRYEQFAVTHPFSTVCGRCRHRLESSPTKDESVPHCAWAGRLRRVTFNLLQPEEANQSASASLPIPVCRQFAPSQPWTELIPAHPEPPGLPRRWLKEQLLHLVKDANRHGSDRNSFEFLTGRPMRSNENYGDWFEKQLETQGGDLSDAQMFTLLVWAYSEWRRAQGREFTLPVNGHGMQFGLYRERPFPH